MRVCRIWRAGRGNVHWTCALRFGGEWAVVYGIFALRGEGIIVREAHWRSWRGGRWAVVG